MSVNDIQILNIRELILDFNSSECKSVGVVNLSNIITDKILKKHLYDDDYNSISESNIIVRVRIKRLYASELDIAELDTYLNIKSLRLDDCSLGILNYKNNIDTFIIDCNIKQIICYTYKHEIILYGSVIRRIMSYHGFSYLSLEDHTVIHTILTPYIYDLYIKNDKSYIDRLYGYVVTSVTSDLYNNNYSPSLLINSEFQDLNNLDKDVLLYIISITI